MNMVEKVARALARDTLSALGKEAFDKNDKYWNSDFGVSERKEFENQAKVAIQAMREPTEEMTKAGYTLCVGSDNMNEIYSTMIDAALKE